LSIRGKLLVFGNLKEAICKFASYLAIRAKYSKQGRCCLIASLLMMVETQKMMRHSPNRQPMLGRRCPTRRKLFGTDQSYFSALGLDEPGLI
jgi:hypothetical protein